MKKKTTNPADHNMAIDPDENPLPFTPQQVTDKLNAMIDDGEVLLVIIRQGTDLGVQVFGPPSVELLDALEQATVAYRTVIRGHA